MTYFFHRPGTDEWHSLEGSGVEGPHTLLARGHRVDKVNRSALQVLWVLVESGAALSAWQIYQRVKNLSEDEDATKYRREALEFVSKAKRLIQDALDVKGASAEVSIISKAPSDGYRFGWKIHKKMPPGADPTHLLKPPPANHNFVIRRELEHLRIWLNDKEGPSVAVLVGGAGFGKTEIVKGLVHRLAESEWSNRYWLDGSNEGELKGLASLSLSLMGRTLTQEPTDAAQREEWLREQRRMIGGPVRKPVRF